MRGIKKAVRTADDSRAAARTSTRSVILFQITALVVGIFLISGIVSSLAFANSQDRLTRKSKEKLIESQGTMICSCHEYISNLLLQLQLLKNPGINIESVEGSLPETISTGTVTAAQQTGSQLLASMIDSGLFDSQLAVFVLPANSPLVKEPTIIMASDNDYIYRPIPPELTKLIELPEAENRPFRARVNESSTYALELDGVAGLGLDGEFLVTSYKFNPTPTSGELWYFDFTPMNKKLASIDLFYNNERGKISRILIIVEICSFIFLVLISFFVLSYLIRRRIIKPIDELAVSAEKVMEGNFDADVPVRQGEEFENLKIAFNEMLGSLKKILHISTGGDPDADLKIEDSHIRRLIETPVRTRGRSSILVQITILVATVFIVSGILSIVLFQDSQGRFVEKSKEKLIQSDAELISSGFNFLSNTLVEILRLQGVTGDVAQEQLIFFQAVLSRTLCPEQVYSNMILSDMIENGLLGQEAVIIATPAFPPSIPEPLVVMSNNDDYLYLELPQELQNLADLPAGTDEPYRKRIDKKSSYMLADGGIPDMEIKGKQLVSFYLFTPDPEAEPLWNYAFKPMDSEMAAINDYYNAEKRRASISLGVVIAGSIILLILITFFVLDFLIRNRITKPIDELADIAEKVMEGELDVEVPAKAGEEFEGLKNAFNEMLVSLRDVLERSTGK